MYPVKTNKLTVTSGYGQRTYTYQGKKISGFHHGIDLIGGSEIIAFDDGVVTAVSNKGEQYGNPCYVRIKHSSGWNTLYYHLKSGSVCVSVGESVKRGQKLGIMGATGQATGVHLHLVVVDCSMFDPNDGRCYDLNSFFNYTRQRQNEGFIGLGAVTYVPGNWWSR